MPHVRLVIRQLDAPHTRTFTCSLVHLTHPHHQKKILCTRRLQRTNTHSMILVINPLLPRYHNHQLPRQTTLHPTPTRRPLPTIRLVRPWTLFRSATWRKRSRFQETRWTSTCYNNWGRWHRCGHLTGGLDTAIRGLDRCRESLSVARRRHLDLVP